MQSRKFFILYEIFKNSGYPYFVIKRKDKTKYGHDFKNNKSL